MRHILFLIVVSIHQVLFAASDVSGQISNDCQNWKAIGGTESASIGFLKHESEKLYFDATKKLWIKIGKDPFIFLERNNEVVVLSGTSIDSHILKIRHEDILIKLITTLAEIGKEIAFENRWTLRTKKGQGELVAMLMGPKKCSAESEARIIICKKEKPCFLGPKARNPEKNVQVCAKELGLLESAKLQGSSRACQIVTDEATYKALKKSYDDASSACKVKPAGLPSLLQLTKICEDARVLIGRF